MGLGKYSAEVLTSLRAGGEQRAFLRERSGQVRRKAEPKAVPPARGTGQEHGGGEEAQSDRCQEGGVAGEVTGLRGGEGRG